ncbi:16S rRNA (uracil(1498)-N(3))-methyltransferase [Hydrogenovibrio kuenenii]|uniref:16S rRNA (uracil(1498)-N(3))-methyltransferase n=1 Tax=Hydrogenovibrio kuenenii TaxID=63658 RepID=UPI0004647A7A|nr:16S rRNA (uracil(1498)-N(3))-methyltransferase [Hydrogenovibrio kuenenii]
MRVSRFYLPEAFTEGATLSLTKEQAHYALTVLRLKHERPVELFDGKGTQAQATLIHTSRRTADVLINSVETPNTESPLKTVLLQGISKGDRMDFTIQKCVELGITDIQPLWTQHCDVKLQGDKLSKKEQHWQEIAINACEQSNRNVVPTILPSLSLDDWFKQNPKIAGLVLDPYASQSLNTLEDSLAKQTLHLLVGPEGGLTDDEVKNAQQHGMTPITLGPRILRTETAGMAVLSILQAKWGDF